MERNPDWNTLPPHAFVSERIRRITEALYRVSELLPDAEPLRWSLRREALQLFEDFAVFAMSPKSTRHRAVKDAESRIGRVLALIELAAAGSYLSELNFAVLKREYEAFGRVIGEQTGELLPEGAQPLPTPPNAFIQTQARGNNNAFLSDTAVMSADVKHTQTQKELQKSPVQNNEASFLHAKTNQESNGHFYNGHHKGHSIGHVEVKSPTLRPIESFLQGQQKQFYTNHTSGDEEDTTITRAQDIIAKKTKDLQQEEHPETRHQEKQDTSTESTNALTRAVFQKQQISATSAAAQYLPGSARKHRIFEFVKQHGWVSVGDLSGFFNGSVSEKTLQRDLGAMVGEGFLKKDGNKRWRRYTVRTA